MVAHHARTVAALALFAVAACARSGGDAAGAAASASAAETTEPSARGACDRITSMSVCSEYAPAQLAKDSAVLASQCRKLGGTYVSGTCPHTAILGTCTLATGEGRTYYASGGAAYDAARAQKECTSLYSGAWKPFP